MRLRHKVEIVAACAAVPCLLELVPATRVLAWIRRVPRRRGDAIGPARLAHHVDRLLARARGPWHYTCLRRASVLALLLRREGRDAEVCFGVRRAADGALDAHAWLRCGGEEPFLERRDLSGFERLERPAAER